MFLINKYVYLLVMFMTRPLTRVFKGLPPDITPISSQEEYIMLRNRCLDHCCLDFKPTSSYTYKSLKEMVHTLLAVREWEHRNHIWWHTTTDAENLMRVRLHGTSWILLYRTSYAEFINKWSNYYD